MATGRLPMQKIRVRSAQSFEGGRDAVRSDLSAFFVMSPVQAPIEGSRVGVVLATMSSLELTSS